MHYSVYTDGACNSIKGYTSAAYFIRSRRAYVGKGAIVYEGSSIAATEVAAIGLAVEKLQKQCRITPEDKITIISDSESAIEFLTSAVNNRLEDFRGTRDGKAWLAWDMVRDIGMCCHVELMKIRAHMERINGNVVADNLAKFSLHQAIWKEEAKNRRKAVCMRL